MLPWMHVHFVISHRQRSADRRLGAEASHALQYFADMHVRTLCKLAFVLHMCATHIFCESLKTRCWRSNTTHYHSLQCTDPWRLVPLLQGYQFDGYPLGAVEPRSVFARLISFVGQRHTTVTHMIQSGRPQKVTHFAYPL